MRKYSKLTPSQWLERQEARPDLLPAWRRIRPLIIKGISMLIVLVIFLTGFLLVKHSFFDPASKTDNKPINFIIRRGQTLGSISRELQKQGIVRNRWVFTLNVDFSNSADKLQAGVYELNRTMTMEQIVDAFRSGVGGKGVLRITFPEGYTVEKMAALLKEKGLLPDTKAFLSMAKSGQGIDKYTYIKDLKPAAERINKLDGYLFPDTYEFYTDAEAADVIAKLTERFDEVFTDEYRARAQALGMSIDEIISLASIIEKEGKQADFEKVSAVFHNRLKIDMKLESCATVNYILGKKRLSLSNDDISIDSKYNTYKYAGLPAGPICNPGAKAIKAALYPDEEYIDLKYLYFATKDPETGELVFARTLTEHNNNVAQYRHLWEEYDREHGN